MAERLHLVRFCHERPVLPSSQSPLGAQTQALADTTHRLFGTQKAFYRTASHTPDRRYPRVKGTHPRLYLLLAHALRLSYHRGENPCLMQTRVPELQGELVILSHSFCYLSQDRDRNA